MIRILLIRHGKTRLLGSVLCGRMPGVHLAPEGQTQAQAVARELKARYKISEVVCSPLERALETADPIAHSQALSISIDEDLNELDFGSWMGKSFTELVDGETWKLYNRLRSMTRPPGGESMLDVQARSWSSIQRITKRYWDAQEATVAVVTHGDVIRALLLLLLGMPLDLIDRLEIDPASVSEVLLSEGAPRVRSINQTYVLRKLP